MARHPVARQLGWQADGKTFVTGQGTPWRVEPRYPEQAAALAAHRPRGTLAAWQEAIAGARDYIVAQVGVYAGLAAPLLCPLGLDSFTVDVAGRSTRGKTITAMAALSCWADPSDRSEAMLSWQTASVIGVEKRLNLVNGLTVVIDETRLVKDPALVDAILYMVPKNHGRPRGGGWPSMIPWRAIVVSTGEQAATSFTSHQGASARVLSIQRAPFGTDGPSQPRRCRRRQGRSRSQLRNRWPRLRRAPAKAARQGRRPGQAPRPAPGANRAAPRRHRYDRAPRPADRDAWPLPPSWQPSGQ